MTKAQRIYRELRKYHGPEEARYVTEWLMQQVFA